MRKAARRALLCATLLTCGSAGAIDPQSAQQYCDEVREAAKVAQQRYIQIAVPRTNPSRTFTDATQACMIWVARAKIPQVPYFQQYPLVQKVFEQFAIQMLRRQCDEMGSQFDKTVQDALRSVNEQTNAVGVVVGYTGNAITLTGPQGAQQRLLLSPPPAAMPSQRSAQQPEAEKPGVIRRLVNLLGGGD